MSGELVKYEEKIGALSVSDVRSQVNLMQQIMREIMHKDEHYGVIPGTGTKPTLLKAGAEKICLTFRLDPQYESTEIYQGDHLTVKSKCTLYHIPSGQRFGSGEGSCSTKESKYAYRQAGVKCPECGKEAIIRGKDFKGDGKPTGWICFGKKGGCGAKFLDDDKRITDQPRGRIPNEDLPDQYNTVLKMANKRSLVAAVLNATAASDIFTQDIEDMPAFTESAPAPSAGHSSSPHGAGHEDAGALLINADQAIYIEDRCREVGVTVAAFCKQAKIERISQLLSSRYDGALTWLDNKEKAAQQ